MNIICGNFIPYSYRTIKINGLVQLQLHNRRYGFEISMNPYELSMVNGLVLTVCFCEDRIPNQSKVLGAKKRSSKYLQ